MINIEKIDFVMEKTGAEYSAVRTALIIANGDVEKAIQFIQSNQTHRIGEESTVSGEGQNWKEEYKEKKYTKENPIGAFAQDIIDVIKDIWERGKASSLVIEKDGKIVLSLSLTVSTIGLVIAPVAAIIGLGAAFITEYSIKIIMDDGQVVDVNKEAVRRKMRGEGESAEKEEDVNVDDTVEEHQEENKEDENQQ